VHLRNAELEYAPAEHRRLGLVLPQQRIPEPRQDQTREQRVRADSKRDQRSRACGSHRSFVASGHLPRRCGRNPFFAAPNDRGSPHGHRPRLLRDQCARTLTQTDFPALGRREEGKVRDSYVGRERRTIVVTDRVSCFDVVVGTLPFKGQVLNQLAAFWFDKTRPIAENHLISGARPVRLGGARAAPLPVEFVMRGYLTGSTNTSILTAYARGDRRYCGHSAARRAAPARAAARAAAHADHQGAEGRARRAGVARRDPRERQLSAETYDAAARLAHALFAEGQRWAASRGLILVDTKYEIAQRADGTLVVVDEIHTPDSSRYWYRRPLRARALRGRAPEALDKEYVRRWLGEKGYKGDGPPPELPVDVRCEASRRYIEAFEQITGRDFEPDTEDPRRRIARNLGLHSARRRDSDFPATVHGSVS
jgi:phosphoribosylaminoimidazole-succinocarboxamide synthase